MQKMMLSLEHHHVTLSENGTLTLLSETGTASLALDRTETVTLMEWLTTTPVPNVHDLLEAESVLTLHRSAPVVLTKINGYEGWTYRDFQTGKRYRDLALYYQEQPVVFLKGWSRHFAEEDNPKRHYATLEAVVEAYQGSAQIRWIDEQRHCLHEQVS